MARLPRLIAPGLPIHVTQRGHNHDRTFLDERDFAIYRECLLEASRRYACAIHAYALMSNHIHLLMTPADAGGAADLMRSMGSRFVQYWHRRHRRSGALWGGRFASAIVGDDVYLLRCTRYIDMNPVKAKLVEHPAEYAWSSYRALALGEPDDLLSPHPTYQASARRSARDVGRTLPSATSIASTVASAKSETPHAAAPRSAATHSSTRSNGA